MPISRITILASSLLFLLVFASQAASPARADDDIVQTVITLVSDKDKDVRAVGLEQVRDEAKGVEATRRFAALLPKLAPEAQVGLLGALAGRGDAAARPAVLEMLAGSQTDVRGAAVRALGALGNKEDVPRLIGLLAEPNSVKDAVYALTHLRGEGVNPALCAAMKSAAPGVRVTLIGLLVARHAVDSVPAVFEAAKDSDAKVRAAALEALGQLAGSEVTAKLAREILDAKDAAAREEAERSLASIARRDPKDRNPALALLTVMSTMSQGDQTQLLPALGRIGGPAAWKVVDAALADADAARRANAIQALCNWPDGSPAPRLVKLASAASDPTAKKTFVDALIRIAPLPDKRTDAVRLEMLKKAMELAASDEQRAMVLKRARAVRSLDTLRFVAPYMDQPKFTQVACETVVELAHHKALRQPNKVEFNKSLDKVILLSKDPEVILRAKHYLKDETWVEKQTKGK